MDKLISWEQIKASRSEIQTMSDKTELYCSYESNSWEIEASDPEDEWDNGRGTGTYDVTGVFLTGGMRDSCSTLDTVKSGDTITVVYVSYDSGDTFGTSGGYGGPLTACKDFEKAYAAGRWFKWKYESFPPWAKDHLKEPEWPKGVYKPEYIEGNGVFDHNQQVTVETFTVDAGKIVL